MSKLHVWCPRQDAVKQLLANDEGARGDEGGWAGLGEGRVKHGESPVFHLKWREKVE